jgi:hypothetical protein
MKKILSDDDLKFRAWVHVALCLLSGYHDFRMVGEVGGLEPKMAQITCSVGKYLIVM